MRFITSSYIILALDGFGYIHGKGLAVIGGKGNREGILLSLFYFNSKLPPHPDDHQSLPLYSYHNNDHFLSYLIIMFILFSQFIMWSIFCLPPNGMNFVSDS